METGVHVVLVPSSVQGHMNPFISIANYLAGAGVSVTLVRSARAHSLLSYAQADSSTSAQAEMKRIRIEVVPDGMPADPKQRLALDSFRESINIICKGVEELLEKLMQEEHPPCCLVIDNLIGWGIDVALKFGLPWMMLWTASASIFSVCVHVPELVARGYIPAIGEGVELVRIAKPATARVKERSQPPQKRPIVLLPEEYEHIVEMASEGAILTTPS